MPLGRFRPVMEVQATPLGWCRPVVEDPAMPLGRLWPGMEVRAMPLGRRPRGGLPGPILHVPFGWLGDQGGGRRLYRSKFQWF